MIPRCNNLRKNGSSVNAGRVSYQFQFLSAIILMWSFLSTDALACACGCSVFDVGFSSYLPKEGDHGGAVYLEWDHSTQDTNWNGTSKAPAANNTDKKINTNWFSLGFQYMINRDWGVMARLPYANRSFKTDTADDGDPSNIQTFRVGDLADAEIMGMYTGFSKDLSTGLIFGLKLPTGNFTAKGFDRDTQLGTGSTDLILGGFHRGMITGDNAWQYFGQIRWLEPIVTQSAFSEEAGVSQNYRPGSQLDGAIGIVYNNGYHIAGFDKIAPVLQIIGSHRQPDSGTGSSPNDTGYDRLLIAPGIDFTKVIDDANNNTLKLYGDVEIPIYQRTNGNQLVSPALFKVITSYTF